MYNVHTRNTTCNLYSEQNAKMIQAMCRGVPLNKLLFSCVTLVVLRLPRKTVPGTGSSEALQIYSAYGMLRRASMLDVHIHIYKRCIDDMYIFVNIIHFYHYFYSYYFYYCYYSLLLVLLLYMVTWSFRHRTPGLRGTARVHGRVQGDHVLPEPPLRLSEQEHHLQPPCRLPGPNPAHIYIYTYMIYTPKHNTYDTVCDIPILLYYICIYVLLMYF